MANTVTAKPGQCLLDVAMAGTGSVEAALELAAAKGIAITDALTPGDTLPQLALRDGKVVAYYQAQGIIPASN